MTAVGCFSVTSHVHKIAVNCCIFNAFCWLVRIYDFVRFYIGNGEVGSSILPGGTIPIVMDFLSHGNEVAFLYSATNQLLILSGHSIARLTLNQLLILSGHSLARLILSKDSWLISTTSCTSISSRRRGSKQPSSGLGLSKYWSFRIQQTCLDPDLRREFGVRG